MSLLKTLFSFAGNDSADSAERENNRKFDILKYDGIKALKIGKNGYAVRCFKEATIIKEEFETLGFLAATLVQLEEYAEALEIYARMCEMQPENGTPRLQRASILLTNGQAQQALDECLATPHSSDTVVHKETLTARALHALHEYEQAIVHIETACKAGKVETEVATLKAHIYIDANQPEKAVREATLAIDSTDENEEAFLLRAKANEMLNNHQQALSDYNEVLELNPFSQQAVLCAGRIMADTKQLTDATELLNDFVEINPTVSAVYSLRAEVRELSNDPKGAAADRAQALELKSEDTTTEGQPVDFSKLYSNRPL